jgi:hypothetical protein
MREGLAFELLPTGRSGGGGAEVGCRGRRLCRHLRAWHSGRSPPLPDRRARHSVESNDPSFLTPDRRTEP